MSADQKLTNVEGVELYSEVRDHELYQLIRTFQFLALATYHLGTDLIIEESHRADHFLYTVTNKALRLTGYIGRDEKGVIRYLVMDSGRIRWMQNEGFELTAENYDKIGVMLTMPTMNDFLLFFVGRGGWEAGEYVRAGRLRGRKKRRG